MPYKNIIACLLLFTYLVWPSKNLLLASEVTGSISTEQSASETTGTLTTGITANANNDYNSNDSSEVTGTLTTGINATSNEAISGIVISAPTANPTAGTYTSDQNITLSALGSLSIHYTSNGSEPTCENGSIYSNPISITSSQTIKAVSCYAQNKKSGMSSFSYTINTNPIVSSGGGGGGGGGGSSSSGGSSVSSLKGDTNNDNTVGILDFVVLMANWGQTTTSNKADFNNDNKVDILDFVILMSNWII